MKQVIKDKVTGHYKIGFAEQFYTLWWVTEHEHATGYTFMKNISKSRERVNELYPGIEIDDNLRGKRGSFYVSNEPQYLFERIENAQSFTPHEGEITIEHLDVRDIFFKMSKSGKWYLSAECINLDRPDFTYVINDFNGNVLANVAVGDIISATGNVGFVYDFKYYLNDVTISGVERVIPKYENGQKINENMTVTGATSEILQLRSDNGRYCFVPLRQRDFRTGRIVDKHMELRDDFVIGNRLNVRATVKDVNGFSQLNYFKCSVTERAEKMETPKYVQFIFFKMDEEIGRGRQRQTVSQEYILCESDIYGIAKKIFDIDKQCQFRFFKNVDEAVEKINKQCIERALNEYSDMGYYTMRFDMCDCRKEREYDRNFRFNFTCVMK